MNILKAIFELIDFTFDNPKNLLKRIDIGVVDSFLAKRIYEVSSLETENFLISLENYGILHAFNQPSAETEKDEQQVPIVKNDFEKIQEVIFEADKIEYWGKSWATNKDLLRFSKTFANKYLAVMEVRTVKKKGKQNRLVLTTFYIRSLKK